MKKLFLFFILTALSLNLLAQNQEEKDKEIYTKDFLIKFADALYLEKENPKEAVKIYEELYTLTPDDTIVLKSLATLCNQTENKTCAQKYIPLYLKAAPQDAWALALNAQLAWQKGNLKDAQKYYSESLKNDPQNQAVLMQYLTLLNTIDKDEAIRFLRQLEQENNLLYMPINMEIAQIYINQNQVQNAISTLDNAIKKYPPTREFYLAKAKIYEINKDINKMLKVYADMDKEGLLTDEDLVKIGGYYALQNKPEEARKYYLRAYQQNPRNEYACNYLSLWEQKQKNYLKAVDYLRQSENFKTNSSLRLKEVHLLNLAGKREETLLAMQQVYQDFNNSSEIAYYYALMLEDNKDFKQAKKVLEKILTAQPENQEFLFNYAYVLSELKDYKKMQQVLEQIIAANPNNAAALNFLGYHMIDKTKQIEKGGEYIKKAISINPKDSATIDSLAWYFYKTDKASEALNLLKSLPKKDAKDPEIIWHFAKVYEKLDDTQNALKYYQFLLNSDEYGAQAKKAIKKIAKK